MSPFLTGLLMALPITLGVGPSLVLYFQATLHRGFNAGLAVLSGIWVSDIGFIFINYFGISHIFIAPANHRIAAIASAAILLVFGFVQWVSKPATVACTGTMPAALPRARFKTTRDFLSGFIVNTSNPLLLAYWITLIGLTGANFGFKTASSYSFLAGIFLGEIFCDTAKCLAFSRINVRFNPRALAWVNRIAGSAMMLGAVVIVCKSFVF